jgi:hypothetical protein
VIDALADAYYLVRGGLSCNKTPGENGAFPTDPYSHTPKHRGVQQPGMTGQVKEEILTRQGELGVRTGDGRLRFQPVLLRRRDFFANEAEFTYIDIAGDEQIIHLPLGSLAFTVCQSLVVYRLSNEPFSIDVTLADGTTASMQQGWLDVDLSRKLFERTGEIARIDVRVPDKQVLRA